MRVLPLLYYLCGMVSLFGQNDFVKVQNSGFDAIKSKLESITFSYIDESLLLQDYPQDAQQLTHIYNPKFIENQDLEEAFHHFHQSNLNYKKPDLGINFDGGFLHNLAGSIIEDDGIFYRNRLQAGLSWDILKDGFKEHQTDYKAQSINYKIDSIRIITQKDQIAYAGIYDHIIYLFNVQKIQLSNRYSHLLSKQLEIAYQLYYLKYIHWEDVLSIMSRKAEIDIIRQNYIDYNTSIQFPFDLQQTVLGKLPLLNINLDSIRMIGVDTSMQASLVDLEIQKDALHEAWKYKPSLKTYLRYNYYNGTNTPGTNRDFVAAGIQINVPISSKKKALDQRLEARRDYLQVQNKSRNEGLKNELYNHYYEYEYAHRKFVQFYHKKLMAINQINRELTKRDLSDPGYSPIEVTKHLDDLYSIDLELLDIQQLMYLKLLKIINYLPPNKWRSIISMEDIQKVFTAFHAKHKLKIKPVTFEKNQRAFLLNYLEKNDVQDVIVPARFGLEINQARSLGRPRTNQILYLQAKDLENLEKPHLPLGGFRSIYIEITSADIFDSEQTDLRMLDILKNLSIEKEVWISVPLETDKGVMRMISEIDNRIVIKLENIQDPERIIDELNSLGVNPDLEMHIELNCRSFLDRFQMEEFIQLIKEQTDLNTVIIDDFEQLIELEANTIQLYEEQGF